MLNRTSVAPRPTPTVTALPWKAALSRSLAPRLIWIVDPETSHQESIRWAARLSRLDVTFASISGQVEALEGLAQTAHSPAIIITDYRGDLKINGAEFIARARQQCHPKTRFVMFSTLVEDAAQFRRLAGGGCVLPDAIVPKPDVFRLSQALADLLSSEQPSMRGFLA